MQTVMKQLPGAVKQTVNPIVLRGYQLDAEHSIYESWAAANGTSNVLAVLPTGAGKTVLFAKILSDHSGSAVAIAHRQELVSQIAIALNRLNVRHRIIAPPKVIRTIVKLQMLDSGHSFYDPQAPVAVAGVDTLIRRGDQLGAWVKNVTLWVQDEAHHVLKGNKWGKAAKMFPNAKGLGVTATPCRADGAGLGRHADGLFDDMVIGPSMRDLIDAGFLTDYRIFAPPSNLDLSTVKTGASGELVQKQVSQAVAASSLVTADGKARVVGDIVTHYLRIAPGKLGVTFVPDLETAARVCDQFNDAGVPAAVVSANTPDVDRVEILAKFKRREYLQLINVDLFGEGFDLPAIEVVSMARPTASFSLFVQQFGRALRLMVDAAHMAKWDTYTPEQRKVVIAAGSKPHAIIIDHVGNIQGNHAVPEGHGLPDMGRVWTLDRREKKRSVSDAAPTRTCLNVECGSLYDRFLPACPFCGTPPPPPADRSGPEYVDGDLLELDPAALAALRAKVASVDVHPDVAERDYREQMKAKRAPAVAINTNTKRHVKMHTERQTAVSGLREVMAAWAGYHRAAGRADKQIFQIFFYRFKVDWMNAQALKADEMNDLAMKVMIDVGRL